MRASVLAASVVMACGGAAPSATGPLSSRATPAVHAVTPAPTITWIDNGFDTTGLPAIARDGSIVVFGRTDNDGGRGNPNLAIMVVDREDAELRRLVVLEANEVDSMFDSGTPAGSPTLADAPASGPGGPSAVLRARIADANRALAELHAQHDLVALTALTTTDFDPRSATQHNHAEGNGMRIDWDTRRIAIQQAPTRPPGPRDVREPRSISGSATLLDARTPATWLAQVRPRCKDCGDPCANPAFLGAVHADASRRIALVTITYAGEDTCWEPPAQQHVVSW